MILKYVYLTKSPLKLENIQIRQNLKKKKLSTSFNVNNLTLRVKKHNQLKIF